jgi:hypothetical protein
MSRQRRPGASRTWRRGGCRVRSTWVPRARRTRGTSARARVRVTRRQGHETGGPSGGPPARRVSHSRSRLGLNMATPASSAGAPRMSDWTAGMIAATGTGLSFSVVFLPFLLTLGAGLFFIAIAMKDGRRRRTSVRIVPTSPWSRQLRLATRPPGAKRAKTLSTGSQASRRLHGPRHLRDAPTSSPRPPHFPPGV